MSLVELWNWFTRELSTLVSWLETNSGTITAFATLVLAALTWVLARATKAMASATSSANVVASLETNQWAWNHLDLVVQNTGSAPAFDVSVSFEPPLPYSVDLQKNDTPFGLISIIRPNQVLSTSVNDFKSVSDKKYRVTVAWKEKPSSSRTSSNSYEINIAAIGAISRLGSGSPAVQIAEQIKKLREDWQSVAKGQKRVEVNQFDHSDREREQKAIEERYREFKEQQSKKQGQSGD